MGKQAEAHKAVFGFKIIDGKINPPVYDLPDCIKERIAYFSECAEDGLSFFGCLDCILAIDEERSKQQFALGAAKPWLDMTEEAYQWFSEMGAPGEMLIAVDLLYGLRSSE